MRGTAEAEGIREPYYSFSTAYTGLAQEFSTSYTWASRVCSHIR